MRIPWVPGSSQSCQLATLHLPGRPMGASEQGYFSPFRLSQI